MIRVVLADDHHFLRSGVEALLADAGHRVVASVDSGEAALAAIAQEDPDVVILDLRMPGMGGIAALAQLRKQGDKRPVIILAAEVDDDALVALMGAGVNAILFKHSAEESLLDAIDAVKGGQTSFSSEIMERAMAAMNRPRTESAMNKLTRRELQIAQGVARGKRNREIAESLNMTEGTVKSYLHTIYAKLGVGNRTELASMLFGEIA